MTDKQDSIHSVLDEMQEYAGYVPRVREWADRIESLMNAEPVAWAVRWEGSTDIDPEFVGTTEEEARGYLEIAMADMFKDYGLAISDCDGDLRDIAAVISELEEIQRNFSASAMSEHQLFLQGKAEMLSEVIDYLRRV